MARLEDRTLLSADDGFGHDLAHATDIDLTRSEPVTLTGTLGASEAGAGPSADVFRISPTEDGRLYATVHPQGTATRLSLRDDQDVVLQSDGLSRDNPDDVVDLHIPEGAVVYLVVEDLGGTGSYTLTTTFTPSAQPFFPLEMTGPGADSPQLLTVGDFNGDKVSDIAASDGIHLGVGDGTFRDPSFDLGIPDDGGVVALISGYFDSDKKLDIAIVNSASRDITVLLGNGDGTFRTLAPRKAGACYRTVTGDFNGDNKLDLAVADAISGDISVLLGNGDGTFQDPVPVGRGIYPTSLVTGDFDGDKVPDLAAADAFYFEETPWVFSADVFVLWGKGHGTFEDPVLVGEEAGLKSLATGDFDGDNKVDLATADAISGDITVLLSSVNRTFKDPVLFRVGGSLASFPRHIPFPSLVTRDFNGDNKLDLAATNEFSDVISVLLGNGDGTFQNLVRFGVGDGPTSLVAGYFDDNGRPDLAVANSGTGDISVLVGNGNGTFQTPWRFRGGIDSIPRTSLVTGDFDGDDRPDLAVGNLDSGDIAVLLGNGDGTFQNLVRFGVGDGPRSLVTGDFNGDGRLDLAAANYGSGDISVLLGNGDGTFQKLVPFSGGIYSDFLVTGDFDGDNKLDLAATEAVSGDISVLLGNGDGTFRTLVPFRVEGGFRSLVMGDFDGDNKTDLAASDAESGGIAVLLGNGNGTFKAPVRWSWVGALLDSLVTGDFDGDNKTDLAASDAESGGIAVLLGNGNGTFKDPMRSGVGAFLYPDSLVTGDFDGDNKLDLAASVYSGAYSGGIAVLLGNGNGTFKDPVPFGAPIGAEGYPPLGTMQMNAGPSSLVARDFNGDGQSDLAAANFGSYDIAVLLGGLFQDPSLVATAPHATPVVADLNGDNADDVVVINAAGDILYRQGQPGDPGRFKPPVKVNPGLPARDVVAVDTNQGWVLASVDATDNAISLYVWRDGAFVRLERLEPLTTGRLPAQIVTEDLNHDRNVDLVVRNAGDGTASVYLGDGYGGFVKQADDVFVGSGASDIALADLDGTGHVDLVVTNQLSGKIRILHNRGNGTFEPPMPYRAGSGLYSLTGITSREATSGVAAGRFTQDGPTDLVTINPGSNWFDVLAGLGAGRFANPLAFPTQTPARVVRVADFNHDGVSDIALLSADKLRVYLGDGKGGFFPPTSYDAGPDPTGLTVADGSHDINHDGNPDLLVGNSFGDVLVLLGKSDGTFQPYHKTDQQIALAVADLKGNGQKDVIYADQAMDQVTVQYGAKGTPSIIGDRSQGVLAPGAVVLDDLDGDGIKDLIVANSGSNNVLVYLGRRDGQFGQALNGGHGFFAGTNPVGITVADVDRDGRPDLVVANKGSNDVSILLNRPQGNSITFTPGPRLKVGSGPVSTVVKDVTGDGIPDVLVSNSQSNNVMLLPGVGGGFFNDQNPKPITLPSAGPMYPFGPGVVVLNPGSNTVTLISDFMDTSPLTRTFPSGGSDPVAAVVFHSDNGFDNLIVANNDDGHVALLEGSANGLILDPHNIHELLDPTALALSSFTGGQVEIYAATEGREAATLLTFQLGGEAGATIPSLQPLHDSALPLIATLLTLTIETSTAEFNPGAFDGETSGTVSFLTVSTVSVGQSLTDYTSAGESESSDGQVPNEPKEADFPVTQESSSWQPFLMGLDEALDQFYRDSLDQFISRDGTAPDKAKPPHALSKPLNLWQHDQALPEARGTIGTDSNDLPEVNQGQIIDEAIRSLWADESPPVRTDLTPTQVSLTPDRNIPAETGPTVPTVSSTEPVQGQEGSSLASFDRGFEALTEFALSLVIAAFVTKGIDLPSTRQCTRRKLESLYRGAH